VLFNWISIPAGPREEVITPPILRAVYGVEVEIVRLESRGEKRLICLPTLARIGF
jgi:ABC-type cobalamin/Fe3+-siderophores transport system ATPase subunit